MILKFTYIFIYHGYIIGIVKYSICFTLYNKYSKFSRKCVFFHICKMYSPISGLYQLDNDTVR
jgi:hypothetical protein